MVIDTAQIARLTSTVSELAQHDVSDMPHDDLLTALEAVSRLGRVTDTLQARFAAELAQRSRPTMEGGGLARAAGFGDAGSMVARVTRGSRAGARRSIEAGDALAPMASRDPRTGRVTHDSPQSAPPVAPKYPVVAQAALEGSLSVEAICLITVGLNQVMDRLPQETLRVLERRLVEKAQSMTAHEVRRMVARAIARVDLPGHEERERRQYAERFLTWTEDHTGMVTLSARLDAVTAAPIRTTIEQVVTAQFRTRRDHDPTEQDRRTVGQMRADALAEICRHALGCQDTRRSGIRTTIVVRTNVNDLMSGTGLGSIDGTASLVSVGQLRRLAGDAGIVPEILGATSEVLDLGRTTRLFSSAQRMAMVERDGGCAKCHAPPEHCEAHHIHWWHLGGRTDLSNGVMLCTRCHHDIHRQGWEIVVQQNRVNFIPPPSIDPEQRPQPGGVEALDVGAIGPPHDRDGWVYPGDDFYSDDESEVRDWALSG